MAISFSLCACSHENEEQAIKEEPSQDIENDDNYGDIDSQETMDTDYAKFPLS